MDYILSFENQNKQYAKYITEYEYCLFFHGNSLRLCNERRINVLF